MEVLLASSIPVSHGGIVGQVWRGGGPRQALLAQALEAIEVRPFGETLGRAAGALLARTGGADVIDAALVLLADDGEDIVTSDPEDRSSRSTRRAAARSRGSGVQMVAHDHGRRCGETAVDEPWAKRGALDQASQSARFGARRTVARFEDRDLVGLAILRHDE
jgi:hypothetical protein